MTEPRELEADIEPEQPFSESHASGAVGGKHLRWCSAEVPAGAERCPRCHVFQPGNSAHLTHGLTSARYRLNLAPMLAKECRAILRQLGHSKRNCPPTKLVLIEMFIEARLVARSYFACLVANSHDSESLAVTRTGRSRAAAVHHGAAVDRLSRLAAQLGLEHKRRLPVTASPLAALKHALGGEHAE